jgi:putative DNA primase/helicase
MSNGDDIARAIDALHFIPPDVPRDTWVKVGMAFHAAGGSFDEFDRWSSGGASYKSKDCQTTWRSFKRDKGIGARTLFAIASEHGDKSNSSLVHERLVDKSSNAQAKLRIGMSATEVWERCEPATHKHPYIVQKNASGVPLNCLRVLPVNDSLRIAGEKMAGALVVPVNSMDGRLFSLQFIATPDVAERLKAKGKPNKLNLPGASIQGWHVVGNIKPTGVTYICEGIGAAWACWQATGDASVVCFGWGRVAGVSTQLRQQHPKSKLVLVPDVGKEEEATKIATTVSGFIAAMPDDWKENSDVSDLAQLEGIDVLESLLNNAIEPPKPPPLLKPVSVADVLTNPASPPEFVWADYIPCGMVTLLGAHGGTGKSTIALMLAVCVAVGRPLFGAEVKPCKVLFASLEDSGAIVRHRLANICKLWNIDPLDLGDCMCIVDGTEYPELFSAEGRGAGELTDTYKELSTTIQAEGIGLVIVDNASDAFAGEEIQRRQVRAFIRALAMAVKPTNAGCLLLAHVDKTTSKARKAEGGEGYSGSTAWHNSARSRLFLTRGDDGLLTLEHQKSNLGKMREPITLEWANDGLPQLVEHGTGFGVDSQTQRQQGRADDERAVILLRMIAEFEGRGQYCHTGQTSRSNPYAVLKSESSFQKLKLNSDATKRIVNQCQRAKWLAPLDYRTPDRKPHQRWTLTHEGRLIAGLSAPTVPTVPTTEDGANGEWAVPTAPTGIGGAGEEKAHLGAEFCEEPKQMEKTNGI